MRLGEQIRRYRKERNLSQEELAEKVLVSRQTISNWENDRNYPDVKSLLLLSGLFEVSLDTLVKGDLEEMREIIREEDRGQSRKERGKEKQDARRMDRDGMIYSVLLFAVIFSAAPLIFRGGYLGIFLWILIAAAALYYAFRIEKLKKQYDIQSYKEIVAFSEGRELSEAEKNQEYGKRPYQKVLLALGTAVITLAVMALMDFLFM